MSHSDSSPPVWTFPVQNSSIYGTVPSYHMPVKFNPTMGIIIGIVFTAFFLMGFLSVYVRRCLARRTHYQVGDVTMPMPMGSTVVGFPAQLQSQGLDKETIQSLPTVQFSSERCLKQGKYSMECSVCLTEFEDDEVLRTLPGCAHSFHPDCIDMWLLSHSTCPLCRSILVPFKLCSDFHNLQAATNTLQSQRSRSFQDVSITIMEEEAEESQQSPPERVWDVEAQQNLADSVEQGFLREKEDNALIPNYSSMPKAASHNHLHRSRSSPAQSLVWEREQVQGFSNHGQDRNAIDIEESSVHHSLRRAVSSEFK